MDTGHSAVHSRQTGKRKRKRLSRQNINKKTSAKKSNRADPEQRSKIRRKHSKNLDRNSTQSVKDDKQSATAATGSSRKKILAEKVKRKRKRSS